MGRSVLWLTGASRGLGRALLDSVPWDDVHVIGVSRSSVSPPATSYEHLAADLSSPEGWAAAEDSFRSTCARHDHPDRVGFIHCAATIQPIGFAGEVPSDLYRESILLNTAAPMVLGHSFIESTDRLPPGTERIIVMLSSGSSSGVYPGWSSYKAGKSSVDEWVRVMAASHKGAVPPLSVLSITPGVVATEMQEQIRAASLRDFPRRDKFVKLYAQGALADAGDVARRIWQVIENRDNYLSLLDLRALPEPHQ